MSWCSDVPEGRGCGDKPLCRHSVSLARMGGAQSQCVATELPHSLPLSFTRHYSLPGPDSKSTRHRSCIFSCGLEAEKNMYIVSEDQNTISQDSIYMYVCF